MNEATLDHKQILDQENWRRLLEPYKRSSTRAAVVQLVDTAVPFVLLWYLMAKSVPISYLLTLALAVPTAFLLVRLFILQHDCGHGSFFPSRVANHVVGSILGVVTLFPYGYWRRTHAMHHATSGNLERRELGDIKTYTVREYRAFSPLRRWLYRLYRHPLVLLGFGPFYQFVLKHRFPFDIPWSWKREWASVVATNVGIAAVFGALAWRFGWSTVLLVHLPIILIGGASAVFLFYVQHQFDDTYWEHQEGWDFYSAGVHGSSFLDLPRPLHWLTGNIGYHHIHHLVSRIPNYRLAQCFDEVPGLQRVTRLSLGQGVRCLGLKLWDEETRTLVGFDAVRSVDARGALSPARAARGPETADG
ncbi:MAG TPA: fatty acid desaturase [Thermoanaerobaculia bacterium]|nr:fatty acid desaturase [Thermoanaerobaculia bacterium]